ncbi:AraC family transcriptional regulator [Methanohalophilus sp. RSK]|uniref:GyrI-like domain-containing protein n=1 Tax=Methanohalophilus sp. RSK TaxID=2485783 RepID=UPI000F43DBC9|nr:AraC family transcriptional regulator [Methanohalophilus sp. RSK]
MTVNDSVEGDETVRIKEVPGGLYAVTSTTLGEIGEAWRRLGAWLETSEYEMGEHQCLKEPLLTKDGRIDEEPDRTIHIYFPVSRRGS